MKYQRGEAKKKNRSRKRGIEIELEEGLQTISIRQREPSPQMLLLSREGGRSQGERGEGTKTVEVKKQRRTASGRRL